MKVEYINPFVVAAKSTCETMLNLKAEQGKLHLKTEQSTTSDLTAIIGLSGKLRGSIVLAFNQGVAQTFVKRFLGMDGELNTAEICDGVGELCNIIGGSAKVELNKFNLNLSISVPNVVIGKGLQVVTNSSYPTLVVPIHTELGNFDVEVCLMEA